MSAPSVAGVVNTLPGNGQQQKPGLLNGAVSIWVAIWMLVGVAGLWAVAYVFRKHVEI